MKRKIIFQALNWRLKDIKNSLGEIKKARFNTVQVSPLQGIKKIMATSGYTTNQLIIK